MSLLEFLWAVIDRPYSGVRFAQDVLPVYRIGLGGALNICDPSTIQLPGGVWKTFPLSFRVTDVVPNLAIPILSGNPSTQISIPACSIVLFKPTRASALGGLSSTIQLTVPLALSATSIET